jgi:FtsP/CotA-like multicopper oxidase with cupredoxin domain
MAGFFIIRDNFDSGTPDNLLALPVFPYEGLFAIQDRMFKDNGELFYPAFPGDPFYKHFIDNEGAELPEDQFPNGGPTVLAGFFGNVMLVNGKIWPRMEVEPRNYRLRLLNGCDSRPLVVQFVKVDLGATELPVASSDPISFTVVADNHALAYKAKTMDALLVEPGARYDIVVNFADFDGSRVIMKNIGPDEPISWDDEFQEKREGSCCRTDRIMACDVVKPFDDSVPDRFVPNRIQFPRVIPEPTTERWLALFECRDEFGRLEPFLGTVLPATDVNGEPILWPDTERPYERAGLAGKQMEGSIGWNEPTTENPKLGTTEEWYIWNLSGRAHSIHLHAVFFDVVARYEIVWDSSIH